MEKLEKSMGVLEEQGRWQAREILEMKVDVKEIRGDVSSLLEFKWKIMGASLFVAFLCSIIVEVARASFKA